MLAVIWISLAPPPTNLHPYKTNLKTGTFYGRLAAASSDVIPLIVRIA
jgi:hypothetical protein